MACGGCGRASGIPGPAGAEAMMWEYKAEIKKGKECGDVKIALTLLVLPGSRARMRT